MCGIFGIVASTASGLNKGQLEDAVTRLFLLSETRGKEAAGIAVLDNDQTIRILKRPRAASEMLKTKEYKGLFDHGSGKLDRTIAVIGHSRLVTNGAQSRHDNNQPVVAGKMVGVHNGIIANVDALWSQYSTLDRQYEVDTEILFSLMRHHLPGTGSVAGAVKKTYGEIEGVANVAAFFEDYNQLLLATNSGSLYLCRNRVGTAAIFASEEYILKVFGEKSRLESLIGPYDIEQIAAGGGCLIDLRDASTQRFTFDKPNGVKEVNGVHRAIQDVTTDRPAPIKFNDASRVGLKMPPWVEKEYQKSFDAIAKLKRCKICVIPETVPYVDIDASGVCAYCRDYKPLKFAGKEALEAVVGPHRKADGKPDILVALSGGRDSCYALHYLKKEMGLNPIAYTYDWGVLTDLSRRNSSRMCAKLGIEHVIVSADIPKKREFIRMNVEAWLKQPDLGTVPLFMAGDKQAFYYAEKLKQKTNIDLFAFAMNPLERTDFKHGFCGITGGGTEEIFYKLDWFKNLQITAYYGKAYLTNRAYLNRSLVDTAFAYFSYYLMPHQYLWFHDFIEWDEKTVESTLLGQYNWERATDTPSTWRIGDGTAAFYNYIYYMMAGFTENDTFRSFQVREKKLTRDEALEKLTKENYPRFESMAWYADTIGIDLDATLRIIHGAKKIYPI